MPDASEKGNDPAERMGQEETKTRVRAALFQLAPRQTQLLLLREMGLSYREMAELLEVAPGSVGTMLARAAESFRQVYEIEA